ncbi:TIGR02099 family protein [Methylomonas paludis]|uniref:TIGR02099 family protein n=1 Tax=Methylomonas paludis TaxID=1173101 RepID=A0A975MLZ2_9GAMM|nr:YhdP family protein [Methylomonas paludis]QWF70313.1 TIGR02099 family protein [Methylomonas paludis]
MFIYHLTRTTQHVLFWALICIAVLLNTVRFFLVDCSDYRLMLEQKIRATTNIPVHIGKISSRIHNFTSVLVLENIGIETLPDTITPAIQLKEVEIGIDLLQLMLSADPLSATWVTLIGANIDAIRQLDGSFTIKGIPSSDTQPLWLQQGHRYQLLDSHIRFTDLKSQSEPVDFTHIDLVLKNHQQQHEIHVLTDLPEQYGESLRISAQLNGDLFETSHLQGQVYIEGQNLQADALNTADLPAGLTQITGSGDLRLWSDWQDARPVRVSGYLQAQQIRVQNSQDAVMHLDTLQGNVTWQQSQGGWRLAAKEIDIVANSQRWVDGEFYLGQDQQLNWALVIKKLDLQVLAHIAPIFINNPTAQTDWLSAHPSGMLTDFAAFVQADSQKYALQGNFSQLGYQDIKSSSSLQGLSGQISGTENAGRINLTSADVIINTIELFRTPLTVKLLLGSISWWQQTESWQINSKNLVINSPDFQTKTDFDLEIPKNQTSPYLDLHCQIQNFSDISKISNYLPAKIMSKDAVIWLDQAFIAGQIQQGDIVMRGRLADFPFTPEQGEFDALLNMENAEMQFNPDWPHLYQVNTDIHFSGADLLVSINQGNSENVEIKQAIAKITDVANSEYVQVYGQLQSKIQDALVYLHHSPLRKKADPLLKILDFDSQTQIDLDLHLPYYEKDPLRVQVASHLDNASLTLKAPQLKVSNINGVLNFTEDQVSSINLTGKTLGYPIQAQLSNDRIATYLKISGSTSTANLEKQFSFLQDSIGKGMFNYQADVSVPHALNQASTLEISSNLQGVSLEGEDFLSKSADTARLLKLNFQFDNSNLLPLQVHYGDNLNAALLIDTGQNLLHSGHVILGRAEAHTETQAGLHVEINQAEFKLSQAFSSLTGHDSRWPALRELNLDTDQLFWQGQNLGFMHGHFQHINQSWLGEVDSPIAKGKLQIPEQNSSSEPLKLTMDTINLTAMSALNFNAAEDVITSLPLIDIDSKQVLWRTVNLGKLKLQTERINNGLHFKKIKFSGAEKDIEFSADWVKQLHGSTTLISGSLSMNGFGQFLSELGFSQDIKETHAELDFTGGWNAAPQQFGMEKLNGQLHIKLNNGRIASIEPGVGRLLGLIAMEQWAKRLSLDFSDIYRQGLAFDQISGDFKITNGVAYTDNMLIDAVSAKMKVVGTTNLVEKTVNHQVAVIPKSSGALPIAGTIVDSVAEIITNVVMDDYKEGYFFGSEYQITGRWGEISVIPINERDGLLKKTWRGLTDFGWLN